MLKLLWYSQSSLQYQVYARGKVHYSNKYSLVAVYTCPGYDTLHKTSEHSNVHTIVWVPVFYTQNWYTLRTKTVVYAQVIYTSSATALVYTHFTNTVFKSNREYSKHILLYSNTLVYTQAINRNSRYALVYSPTTHTIYSMYFSARNPSIMSCKIE